MFGFRNWHVAPILILLLGEVLSSPVGNTLENNRKGRQDDGDEDGDGAPQEFLGPPDRPTIPPRIGLLPQVGQLVAHFAKGNQNFGTNLTSFVGTATSLLPGNLGGQVFNVLKIFTGDNNKKIKPDPIPGSVPGFAPAPVPGHAPAPAVPALPITDDPLLREINILSQFKPSELKLLAENGNLNHISPDALFVFGITLKPTSVNPPTAKPEKLEYVPLPTSFSFPTIKTVDFDDEVGFGLGPTLGPVKTKTRLPPPPPSTATPVPAEAQDIKLFLEISEATQPPAPKSPPLFSLPTNLLEPGRERPKPTPKPWKEVPGSADNLFSNVLLANDLLRPKEPLNFQNSEIPVGSTQQKPISVSYVPEVEETTVLPAKYTVNKRRKPPSVHQEQAALQAEQLKLLQQAGSLLKPEVTESPVEQDELKQTYSKPKLPTTTTPQPAFSSQYFSQHNQFLPPEEQYQIQQQQQQQQQNPQFNRFGRPRPPFRGPFERPPPGFNIDEDEDSDENDLKGSKEEKRKPEPE